MNKRQLQKEKTKEKIVENAYMLYAQEGFQVSTSEIAKQSEVAHGSIFSHFPTKEDLLIFVIGEFGNKLTTRLHEISVSSMPLEDALYAHIEAIEEYEDFYINFINERHRLPKEATVSYISIQSAASHHLEKVLEREKIVDIPLNLAFNSWVGLLHYYLLNRDLFAPNTSVIKKYKNELVDTFIKMIKK